ncbi:D-alanyl-D-alanine carboxypeptidase family protein [Mycobacterium sp. 141]|uniref:D-alanyl-D-alanine carboxypeptidase family protein n=1 Tax=Mycobacterium sp. 141 TaxID=1120797 RepID=UPI00037BDE29|nr:D-alanyl-D-alanine carboxypeptidase family protein [Mycobacterium sp. 141]
MGRLICALAVLLAALSTVLSSVEPPAARADMGVQQIGSAPIPDGPAEGWVVADLDTGEVLAARNENTRYAPASTIKTLLAQVVLDELPLDSTIVADEADSQAECTCAGVTPGQTYTARQLLETALLDSGNDAANTLAHMLGGPDTAVAKMNAKAAQLGAHDTNVVTPSGLDAPGMPFWSTPHDMAVIFRAAMANSVFAQITAMPSTVFPTKSGERVLQNQNELLRRYPGTIGGKTGFTDIARKTFVAAAQRDGRRLVISMMHGLVKEGGPTYWDQAAALLDWGFLQDHAASIGSL